MSDEIKVLHIFAQMNRGGAETLIMNVMRNRTNKRIKFIFAVTNPVPGHYDEEIIRLGGEIIYIGPPTIKGNFPQKFKKVLRVIKPNVVHSHVYSFSGYILYISRQFNIPIRIAHSHTINDNKINSPYRYLYFSLMKRLINKNATHLLGCSMEACAKLFPDKFPRDRRIEVIKNGIDLNKFKPLEIECKSLRSFLEISSDSIIVGHVGSFRYPKNHEKVIDVFKNFYVRNRNAHLVLIGSGPLEKDVKETIQMYELQTNVHFLGVREDVPKLMQQFDLFLFPSRYEGLGLVLIEAQVAGVPCITTNKVPREVDLEMNMIKFLSLNDSDELWVSEMSNALKLSQMSWKERVARVESSGYNIKYTVRKLETIYEEALVSKI